MINILCILTKHFAPSMKSQKKPNEIYTYGYGRLSVLGGVITSLILIIGSVMVVLNALNKIIHPEVINYNGMILFAVFGVLVNFCAAVFTHGGISLNQKAVNLHMLEDVLGWLIVLAGGIIMKFTDFSPIDPILSIGVSIFILINAVKNLNESVGIFLEKAPIEPCIGKIKEHLLQVDGVLDIHHIHIWSIDGQSTFSTMHIVANRYSHEIKEKIREELSDFGIIHSTLEFETAEENCRYKHCRLELNNSLGHHKHHH